MPLVDIKCRTCGEYSEVFAPDITAIECGCGSLDVERKWTAPPMFIMVGDKNGSTIGTRKYAKEITTKAREKNRREGGISHENAKVYW